MKGEVPLNYEKFQLAFVKSQPNAKYWLRSAIPRPPHTHHTQMLTAIYLIVVVGDVPIAIVTTLAIA